MVSFGGNIYLWRIFKGLSQEELAKRSGIPRTNLSAIENGKREVSLVTLRALAVALEIAPGVLVNGVAPLCFKKSLFSRVSLENIVEMSLGKIRNHSTAQQRIISAMLSRIIKNRINAQNKIYKNILLDRKTSMANWLMLKAAVETEALNNLLTRLDKHI